MEAIVSHIPSFRANYERSVQTSSRGERMSSLFYTFAAYGILFFLVASFIQTKLLQMRLVSKKIE